MKRGGMVDCGGALDGDGGGKENIKGLHDILYKKVIQILLHYIPKMIKI